MRNLFILALFAGVLATPGGQARAEQPAAVGGPAATESAPLPSPRPRDVSSTFDKLAQSKATTLKATAQKAAAPKAAKVSAPPRAKGVPDDYKIAMLIRTSLIALNQANITGNYSVLRDLGAPGFRDANNPTRLAELFANLRLRSIDLEPILVVDPKVAEPFINERGMLRIKGFFPTAPEQVNFELAYQLIGQQWRLFAISVTTSLAVAQNPSASATVAR
jgi:hypothetical protein